MIRFPLARLTLIAAGITAGGATRAATSLPAAAGRPACEAFVDERELRFRQPARTVAGRILPESVVIDEAPALGVGMTLVSGRATLAEAATGVRLAVTFAYWQGQDGCSGWGPARGVAMTFDLADDRAADGALRVMRAGVTAGATR